jgi:hypothetical protein
VRTAVLAIEICQQNQREDEMAGSVGIDSESGVAKLARLCEPAVFAALAHRLADLTPDTEDGRFVSTWMRTSAMRTMIRLSNRSRRAFGWGESYGVPLFDITAFRGWSVEPAFRFSSASPPEADTDPQGFGRPLHRWTPWTPEITNLEFTMRFEWISPGTQRLAMKKIHACLTIAPCACDPDDLYWSLVVSGHRVPRLSAYMDTKNGGAVNVATIRAVYAALGAAAATPGAAVAIKKN